MSKLFRGLAEPQMTRLREDLVLIEFSDPGAVRARMSTNTFVLLKPGKSLLIDTAGSPLIPFVRRLRDEGFPPAALALSHRHVAGAGDAIYDLANEFAIPVLLHPLDARHPQSFGAGVSYEDPVDHPVLAGFGVEALPFPGHTSGHVVFYSAEQGGLLITGDAAMSTTAPQAEAGVEHLVRPPLGTNVDDQQLRKNWAAFDRPVATFLPYHGTGYVNRASDLPSLMKTLSRPEPTMSIMG